MNGAANPPISASDNRAAALPESSGSSADKPKAGISPHSKAKAPCASAMPGARSTGKYSTMSSPLRKTCRLPIRVSAALESVKLDFCRFGDFRPLVHFLLYKNNKLFRRHTRGERALGEESFAHLL